MQAQKDSQESLDSALRELRCVNDRRGERTRDWAAEIEQLSSGTIKAVVVATGDRMEIKETVDAVSAKTGSQEATRLNALEAVLDTEAFADLVDRLRTDCFDLLYWRQVGAASGEEQPKCADLMKLLGDTDHIRKSVTERMDTSRVEAIATAVPRPEVTLSYCDGSREISFEKASEGQRAAALLFMLLEQPGGPLIIDQPEGDLDNRIICDLTDRIHNAKQNRQLVFASPHKSPV